MASLGLCCCQTDFGSAYPLMLGIPDSLAGKESTYNAGDMPSILGLGRSPGEGKGYPLQYSGYWPRESCGLCSPWGCKELNMTEWLSLHFTSPSHVKANLLRPGCGEEKCGIYCRHQMSTSSSCSEALNSPVTFSEGRWGRVARYAIISLYNSLVVGEVTEGVTGVNITYQPPADLCTTCSWSSCS